MQASRKRDLSNTWIHGEDTLVELYMSSHQFSELITSPNQGDGVPCTLRHTHKERNIEYPGHEPEAKMHRDEFKDRVNAIGHKSKGIIDKFNEMGKGKTIKKSEFQELGKMVEMMLQDYHSNLPFVEESFKESMDKTVSDGKRAIESYIAGRIRSAGLKSLDGLEPKLLEDSDE